MSFGARERAAALTPHSLHLIVMPTEACNFRCTYCYEDFALGRMSASVVRGIEQLISRRAPELRRLLISWFGGEPLLAVGVIASIMDRAQALATEWPALRVTSDITTNAYRLDVATATQLLGLGVRRYQISFDGPADVHDQTRCLAGGTGTFTRIWNNVTELARRPEEFEVLIRVHITRDNVERIPEFLRMCADTWGRDTRFRFFLRPVSDLGGSGAQRLLLEEADRLHVVARLTAEARQCGLQVVAAEDLQPVCYAAHANSFVLRADGRVGKCTVALDDPKNSVGRLLESGELQLDTPRMRGWMRGLWTEDAEELRCPMRGLVRNEPGVIPITPRGVTAVVG